MIAAYGTEQDNDPETMGVLPIFAAVGKLAVKGIGAIGKAVKKKQAKRKAAAKTAAIKAEADRKALIDAAAANKKKMLLIGGSAAAGLLALTLVLKPRRQAAPRAA